MERWDVVPRSLRLPNQGAVPPERPESPLRPEDSSSSSSDDDDDDDDYSGGGGGGGGNSMDQY
jgi:hypothetical protein